MTCTKSVLVDSTFRLDGAGLIYCSSMAALAWKKACLSVADKYLFLYCLNISHTFRNSWSFTTIILHFYPEHGLTMKICLCQCDKSALLSWSPSGLVAVIGTILKYPEVRIFSSMMSSRMLFLQSSSQLRHVALLSSEIVSHSNVKKVILDLHPIWIYKQCCYLSSYTVTFFYLPGSQGWHLIEGDWSLGICSPAPPSYCDCKSPSSKDRRQRMRLIFEMLFLFFFLAPVVS